MASKKTVNARAAKKPRLGQNFLRDSGAALRIVEALGDLSSSTVVEIGPGKAVLTEILSQRAKRLIGIELDRSLAAQLRMQYARKPNVEIIEADVLQVDLANLIRRRPGPLLATAPNSADHPAARARIVGNLPYYITSDILLHLFEFHQLIETIVIMVQREVADRIAASPGSRDYGLLSATCQLYAKVEKLFTLPPGAFSPAPKVHSAVLRLTIAPRWESLQVSPEPFFAFLKGSFGQKRKTLANNLKEKHGRQEITGAFAAAKVRPDARAESLSLEQMARIFRLLHQAL